MRTLKDLATFIARVLVLWFLVCTLWTILGIEDTFTIMEFYMAGTAVGFDYYQRHERAHPAHRSIKN